MIKENVEMNVKINGSFATTYLSPEDGFTYIEGRKDSEYELVITNRNAFRVLAVPSVDGLSVLDGKVASIDSNGYVLSPYETISIPGWTLNKSEVAKFKFGSTKDSYSSAIGKGEANIGVIGLVIWKEKVYKPTAYLPKQVWRSGPISHEPTYWYDINSVGTYGIAPQGSSPLRGSSSPYSMDHTKSASALGAAAMSNVGQNSAYGRVTINASYSGDFVEQSVEAAPQSLGTEFGQASAFATRDVHFEKDVLLGIIEIYYDDANGLVQRGIHVRPIKTTPKPNAFPASGGCKPPANWKK